jgi:long-chain fatty acid transport protein
MNIKHQGYFKYLLAAGCITSLIPAQLLAGGYKIPENSINSTALSAAYVANAHGADAAYYNPAAMVFNEEGASMEANLTYIHLSAIDYTDMNGGFPSDSSEKENFLIPSFHYVSPSMGNYRFGLSVVTPAGLSKRWDGFGKATTEEFTLKTIEVNPSVAYKFNDQFSAAVGARVVYANGDVRSNASAFSAANPIRDLGGSSYDLGYNLALHFKPTDELALALTYRSKIDLTLEGQAEIQALAVFLRTYDGDAKVSVPLPAALNLAAAYTFNDTTTVELVYEKTYWSAYKELDFDYDSTIDPVLNGIFGAPITKNWSDTDTYRIGVTHKLDNDWTLMAGYAIDKTPAPKSTAGFELPDSDAQLFSFGARYQYSDDLNVGFGLLYDKKETLRITPTDGNSGTGLSNAKFEDTSAFLLTVGMQYNF